MPRDPKNAVPEAYAEYREKRTADAAAQAQDRNLDEQQRNDNLRSACEEVLDSLPAATPETD